MATLHTVSRSPFRDVALESCLRVALPGSAVLLLEDGVYGALASGAHAARFPNAGICFALSELRRFRNPVE